MLTRDTLEALAAYWRAQAAPILTHLQPGLSYDEMDAITVPLGIRLPAEARVWWGWHDGVAGTESAAPERQLGPGYFTFMPLAQAADWYRTMRELARIGAEKQAAIDLSDPRADADTNWPRGRFPIFAPNNYDIVAFECAVPDGAPSPLHYFNLEGGGFTHGRRAESFAQMVGWWLDAFGDGNLRYDSNQAVWHCDWHRLPDHVRSSGLV